MATPSALQQLMSQEGVPDNDTLLEALNAAPSKEQRQWILAAIQWFADQKSETLSLKPAAIQDYAALAHVRVDDDKGNREHLERYFYSLCKKVEEGPEDEWLIQALPYALTHIHLAVFAGRPIPLTSLGDKLLKKLDPSKWEFKQADYLSVRATLKALFQTFLLIEKVAPNYLNIRDGGRYQDFRKRLQAIVVKAKYYPILYYARLLKQTLCLLEDPNADLETNLIRVWEGCKGVEQLYKAGRAIALPFLRASFSSSSSPGVPEFVIDLPLSQLGTGVSSLQKVALGQRIRKEPWYKELRDLEKKMLRCLKNQPRRENQNPLDYPDSAELQEIVQNLSVQTNHLARTQQYHKNLRALPMRFARAV